MCLQDIVREYNWSVRAAVLFGFEKCYQQNLLNNYECSMVFDVLMGRASLPLAHLVLFH